MLVLLLILRQVHVLLEQVGLDTALLSGVVLFAFLVA